MAAQGNLILVFTVFVVYSFIGWGIGLLYGTSYTQDAGMFTDNNATVDPVLIGIQGISVMTMQDSRIPDDVNNLIIIPLNLLSLGAVFYFIRGGGT